MRLLISSKRIDKKSGQTSQSIKQLQEKDDVFDDLSISSPNYYTERQISALLGEIYEKYIGQLLENRGYSVEYNGINKGKEDGGVDLIARKGRIVALVQCKNWNQKQVIHENIFISCRVPLMYGGVPEINILGYSAALVLCLIRQEKMLPNWVFC